MGLRLVGLYLGGVGCRAVGVSVPHLSCRIIRPWALQELQVRG